MKEIRITDKEAGQRLDKFLMRYLPEAGKSFLYKMMRKKNIVLNGKKCTGSELLKTEDSVKLFFAEETLQKFLGSQQQKEKNSLPSLDPDCIIYEDEQMLAVNKPVGMLSQKAEKGDLSLTEYLTGYLFSTGALDEEGYRTFHPGVCNRLDRNTSGLVLAGKNNAAARALYAMFQQRSMEKYYLALVRGEMKNPRRIRGYLKKDAASNKVTVSDREQPDAAYIETAYEPLETVKGYTLLKVELITGRTHQIRSHLSYIGHPIVGDSKYGSRKTNELFRKQYGLQHQFLHAEEVIFPALEPPLEQLSGKSITAPLPGEKTILLQKLGFKAEL
ncbi:MAG: RluA family pseudouridine synthase [Lachnospiraceae bacterium]|nr:RluA family pseudouridine synthase [Lachnospiraceae bacterium]